MKKCDLKLTDNFFGVATVGERGQIVIPANARKKTDIKPGDKVIVIGNPHCSGIMIVKAEALKGFFSDMLEDFANLESTISEIEKVGKDEK